MEDNQLNFNQPFLSVRHKEDIKNPKSHKSDVNSGHVRNPGSVPFVWEQSPGKRKDENKPHQIDHSKRFSTAPKLPPGRQESDHSSGFFSQDNKDDHHSDSSDDDEVYVDALDTLSRTESFFLNCSVSGVSGFEDAKPPGSTDPRAKDFMIGRFLPAAKAMASESPQNTQPRKQQPLVTDQSRQPKKIVNEEKRPQLRYGPSFAKQHAEYYDNRDDESDEDLDESEILQAKVCGLVPRFFLNRIPARSVRTTRPSVSSVSSWSKTEHERSSFDTNERKSMDGSLMIELHEEYDSDMKTELVSQASESKNTSNADLNSLETGYKTFKDMLLSEKNSSEELDSEFLEIEKTIYVDSVRKFNNSPQNDQEHDNSRKGTWADFYLKDKLNTNHSKIHDFKVQDPKLGFSKKQILEAENIGGLIFPDFSIPPPLPKSPSDSWLYRTLPLIYPKNTFKTSKTQELLASIPEN